MCGDAYAALDGADAAVLLTEWNEFRALDLGRVRDGLRAPVFVDLRNVYPVDEMGPFSIDYTSIGRNGRIQGS